MPPDSRNTATVPLGGWSASQRARCAWASSGSAHRVVRSTCPAVTGSPATRTCSRVSEPVRSPVGHGRVVEAPQAGRHGDRGGLAVRDEVAQLVLAVRRQRHDGHDARAQAAEGEHDELPAVGQLDDDPVLPHQAEVVDQPAGERVRAGGQGAVGEPDVAVDERDRVRAAHRRRRATRPRARRRATSLVRGRPERRRRARARHRRRGGRPDVRFMKGPPRPASERRRARATRRR